MHACSDPTMTKQAQARGLQEEIKAAEKGREEGQAALRRAEGEREAALARVVLAEGEVERAKERVKAMGTCSFSLGGQGACVCVVACVFSRALFFTHTHALLPRTHTQRLTARSRRRRPRRYAGPSPSGTRRWRR